MGVALLCSFCACPPPSTAARQIRRQFGAERFSSRCDASLEPQGNTGIAPRDLTLPASPQVLEIRVVQEVNA